MSRFPAWKAPHLAWTSVLGSTSPPSSAGITLGVEHAIYSSADQAGRFGFAKVGGDGSIARWLPESSGVAPVLGSGGALYTGSGNLLARRDDGSSIWSLAGSSFAQGEVVVGADGMLYVAGGTLSGMGLSAVTAAGEIAWHVDANPNLTIATWAAVSRDRAIYFGAADGDSASNVHQSLFAVSRSGQVLWKHVLGDFATVFPVVGHDDNVYVGNGHALWSFDPSGAVRFQVIDPSENEAFSFLHLAIGPDGTIYATWQYGDDGQPSGLTAFSSSGQRLWSFTPGGGSPSAPVVDRDGTVFIAVDNLLEALNPNGTALWSYTVAGASFCTALVIDSDSSLYALCDQTLYAVR